MLLLCMVLSNISWFSVQIIYGYKIAQIFLDWIISELLTAEFFNVINLFLLRIYFAFSQSYRVSLVNVYHLFIVIRFVNHKVITLRDHIRHFEIKFSQQNLTNAISAVYYVKVKFAVTFSTV